MRFALLLVFVSASCLCGCDRQAEMNRQAILRVLKADKQLKQMHEGGTPQNANASQLADVIGDYCDDLEKLDMSDCPADFRVAFRSHIRAWRDMQSVIAQLPDGFMEAIFMGFINGLSGELDGGYGRLNEAFESAKRKISATYAEVESVAAGHNAAL